MADKSPAFQLYPKDLLSDENVILMDPWAFACYVKLICVCWLEGSIPANHEQMAILGGTPRHHPHIAALSDEEFATGLNAVQLCFRKDPEDKTRLTHPRLDSERQKQTGYSEQKRIAGQRSGEARREKARKKQKTQHIEQNEQVFDSVRTEREQTMNRTRTKTNSSTPSPLSFASPDENTPPTPPLSNGHSGVPDDAFLKLQEAYPKDANLYAQDSANAFGDMVEDAADPAAVLAEVHAGLERMTSSGTPTQFMPSLADFLRKQRFREKWEPEERSRKGDFSYLRSMSAKGNA